jgi:hypothetical protein
MSQILVPGTGTQTTISSSSGYAVMSLNRGIPARHRTPRLHHLIEAIKLARADRLA